MIAIAAVIAVATAAGFWAEHRWAERSERIAALTIRLMLWVLVPPVVVVAIVELELDSGVAAGIGFGLLAQLGSIAIAYVVGTRLLRLSRPAVGALMLAAGFGNTAFLGLPMTEALFGADELPDAIVWDLVLTTLAVFSIGVAIAAAFGTLAGTGSERVRAFFTRNPPLWACAIGLLAPAGAAPDWTFDALQVIVYALLPLGFFVVGLTLAAEADEGVVRFPPALTAPIGVAIALKLVAAPALLIALSAALIDVPDSFYAQAAMPSAIATLMISHEYGLDRGLVAAAIAWSTAVVVAAGLAIALL